MYSTDVAANERFDDDGRREQDIGPARAHRQDLCLRPPLPTTSNGGLLSRMRRHAPTLYAHSENDEAENGDWDNTSFPPTPSVQGGPASSSTSSSRRFSDYPSRPPNHRHPSSVPNMLYSDFVKRYRSSGHSSASDDPDNHYLRAGLGQLLDEQAESDGEEISLSSLAAGLGTVNSSLLSDSDPLVATSDKDKDRSIYLLTFMAHTQSDTGLGLG